MNISEYQLALKNMIDDTRDETLLKRWKEQLEADLRQNNKTVNSNKPDNSGRVKDEEAKTDKKDDTSDYVVIESGLGIDE
jgi:hypothetical protein